MPSIGSLVGRDGADLRRLLNFENVPPRRRLLQATNACLTPLVDRAFRLVHIVEHPKCGGSWVRDTLLEYTGHARNNDERLLRPGDILHGHRLYRRSWHRPIVVVRDPRDMFVSLYHHETSLRELQDPNPDIGHHFATDPSRSQRDDFRRYLEIRLNTRMHPWFYFSEFLDSWLQRPGVCVVRYEDMLRQPIVELVRMLRFIGEPVDLARAEAICDEMSFASQTKKLYGAERKPGETDNTRFLRRGSAGDWVNHFDAQTCELFWRLEGPSLVRLGYERDASWIERFVAGLPDAETAPQDATAR